VRKKRVLVSGRSFWRLKKKKKENKKGELEGASFYGGKKKYIYIEMMKRDGACREMGRLAGVRVNFPRRVLRRQ
jgi:hypothetical protein